MFNASLGRLVGGFVFVGVSLLCGEAKAVEHNVCLYFDIGDEFWDASTPGVVEFNEEFGRNEGSTSYPAQRWLARVTHDKTGTVGFGWAPLDENGCARVDVPSLTSLTIEWMRWSHWETTGNQIIGYDCDASMTSCDHIQDVRTFTPSSSNRTNVIIQPTLGDLPKDTIQWVTSFAEERFSSMGENTLTDARAYATYDEADVLPGISNQNDRNFGNQPGFAIITEGFRRKWTIAHEYGHVQTSNNDLTGFGVADLDYCADQDYPSTANSCSDKGHAWDSFEWSGAALVEGLASWYALATWQDVDLVNSGGGTPETGYTQASSATANQVRPIPRTGGPLCLSTNPMFALPCVAGTSNEWDWISMIQSIRLSTGASMKTLLEVIIAYYPTGWVAASPDNSFFTGFDLAMQSHLSATEYQSFVTESQAWNVDL